MFPDISKFVPMLQTGLEKLEVCLAHIYGEVKAGREAGQAQARILAFEFGVVDVEDSARIAPRRLSNMPVIVETTTAVRADIDVETANQGRAVSRGFYANLGENAFKVTLIGVGGQASAAHTVPPGTTISLTCLVSHVVIDPGPDGPAFYQLYMH
ncbi:hypothetical protein E7T09_04450 [Deinococcus sp. KSM4-11]|uniref:hypothetical protein n=1 Tax=Deinococcus sp. KSM4-11 TaxID=2568654 RepID=UPI0010A59213|nr:hypothetical protein [Deinococcus sp. KSM4-11]THF88461.1 hypothetical protein E7T09_04450 [Deinococcus sp. KSM4-11]